MPGTGFLGGIATIGVSESSNGGRQPTDATYWQRQANVNEAQATSPANALVGGGGQIALDAGRQQLCLASPSNGDATCSSIRHPDAVQSLSREQTRGGQGGVARRRLHFAIDEVDCSNCNLDDKHCSPFRFSPAASGLTSTNTNKLSPKPENFCKFGSSADGEKPFDNGISNSILRVLPTKPSPSDFQTATSGQQRDNQSVLSCRLHIDSASNVDNTTTTSGWLASCRLLDGDDELLVDVGHPLLSVDDRQMSAAETLTEIETPLLIRTSGQVTSCRISMKAATAVSGRPEDLDELPYFDDDDDDVFATDNGICASSAVSGWQVSAKIDGNHAEKRRHGGEFPTRADALGFLCSVNSDGTAGDWTDGDIELVPVAEWQGSRNYPLADDNEDDENHIGQTTDGSAKADEGTNWSSPVPRRDARYVQNLLQPSMPSERQALLPLTCNLRIPGENSVFTNATHMRSDSGVSFPVFNDGLVANVVMLKCMWFMVYWI